MERGARVAIPKLGKDDYNVAKACRAISLLNYLGKMVEKVAAVCTVRQAEAST